VRSSGVFDLATNGFARGVNAGCVRVSCGKLMMRDCNCDPRQLARPFISVSPPALEQYIFLSPYALLTLLHRARLALKCVNSFKHAAACTESNQQQHLGRAQCFLCVIITGDARSRAAACSNY